MRKLIGILPVLLLAFPMKAQTIAVEAPNLVSVDEQFNVTFTIDGENAPSDFNWSPGGDFKLVWGPQKGTSTSISIVNGKRSRSAQTTYTYVLMPVKAGTFSLAPATATVKGDKLTSAAKSIQVVSGSRQQGSQGQASGGAGQGAVSSGGTISDSDVFLRLSLSKTSAVVGETISATLKLFQRVNIAGFEDARFPTFDGFWSQEVQAPTNIEFHRENVGGEIYNSAVLRSWNLIPQKAGEMKIDPAELVCLVHVRQASTGSGSIFDSFFQDDYRTIRKRVSTPSYTVHVSALPPGAPASFGGGVGKFTLNASLSTDSLKTHDAASLKVTVSGTGNISLLEAPKVGFPPDFEVYDVKSSDSRGVKTFEYPFIPRSHGSFTIGPVEYSYYDIQAGKYVTLRSAAMPLEVVRGAATGQPSVSSEGRLVARNEVKDLGSDIRYIATRRPSFKEAGRFFVWSAPFWGVLAFIVLAAVAAFFILRSLSARRDDVALTRNRGAMKMARKKLASAGDFLRKDLYTAFYEELHKALQGFVSDKLNMDITDMTRDNIKSRLQDAGSPEGLAEEFCSLLDACEYARYSPDAGHEAMNAHYESAVSVISRIDSSMKKKNAPKPAVLAALLLLVPFAGQAADYADSLWTKGVEDYAAGDWYSAANAWGQLVSAGAVSPELYTNLGDACFKSEDYARAIVYYKRALKLDPSYKDARYNLGFARGQVQDRIESVPEFFLVGWMRNLGWKLSSDAWAVLCLVFLAGALAMLLLFLQSGSRGLKKTGFFAGIALFLLSLASLAFASWQKSDYIKSDDAVVTAPVVSVKSAPGGSDGKDLFILHEGAEVRVIDNVGDWVNIELPDGRQGWTTATILEKI